MLMPKEFPVDVLPEPMRSFVKNGAKAIGCDPSYIGLPAMSALAGAIGNTRRIQLKRGWTEPAIVWTAIVGESGTMKSPAIRLAMHPVRERQRKAMLEHEEAIKKYNEACAYHDRAMSKWKGDKTNNDEPPPEPPDKPVADRCWTDDTTMEALVSGLKHQPRGLLVIRDELAGLFGSFDKYTNGKGSDAAKWLEMHGGGPVLVDRKGSGTLYIPRAAVSIAGGVQPEILKRSLGAEHRENGFAARLLIACPERQPKRWTDAEINLEDEQAMESVFEYLFSLDMDPGDDEPKPVLVRLNKSAKRRWIAFFNHHADEQVALVGDLAAAWSKLEGYAARLALIVHYVRLAADDRTVDDPYEIDEVSIGAGITISNWFGEEARRVYRLLDESDDERDKRRLVAMIRAKGGTITAREMIQSLNRIKNNNAAKSALNVLVDAGLGSWEWIQTGHRPKEVFRLHEDIPSSISINKSPDGDIASGGYVTETPVGERERY